MPDAVTPLSEDALNRYRLAHTDRDLKPLLTRLHRLAHLSSASASTSKSESKSEPTGGDDSTEQGAVESIELEKDEVTKREKEEAIEREKEVLQMELRKWGVGIKRSWAAAIGIQKEEARLRERSRATVERTEMLEAMLVEEKKLLERRQRERDGMRKCDEVAERIWSRTRSRQELDEQIETLQQQLEEHRASYEAYRVAVQSRIDTFAQISRLVDECRNFKLPVDPSAPLAAPSDKMDVDEPASSRSAEGSAAAAAATANTKLNAGAPAFQPKPSLPASLPAAPAPAPAPSRSSTPTASGISTLPPPPIARPPAARAPSGSARGARGLPSRPSALRSSTVPVVSGGAMEEGEVGEDGEVDDRQKSRGRK